jgi:type II secretory pathway pseudopilin PulG
MPVFLIGAFTLIELLIVMAIIIVLAGLILATANYVQKKGYRSRAEAEIAAISAALENYKADNGVYPRDANSSDQANPTAALSDKSYTTANLFLYEQLFGASNGARTANAGAKTLNRLCCLRHHLRRQRLPLFAIHSEILMVTQPQKRRILPAPLAIIRLLICGASETVLQEPTSPNGSKTGNHRASVWTTMTTRRFGRWRSISACSSGEFTVTGRGATRNFEAP